MVKQLILSLALLCSPAWATWTCADGGTGCTSTTVRQCSATPGTTCNITVSSTAAGSVEVMCARFASNTPTLTGSGDGTWVTPAASKGSDSTTMGGECAYNLNATGGATTVTCTITSSASLECQYFRFTGTGSSFTFDTSGSIDDATCTTCAGVGLTLGTSNNYILIQGGYCGGTCSAINQTYTIAVSTNTNALAYKINVSTAGTTPNWTQTSGVLVGSAMAIYEVTSSCKPTLTLMGVGRCG